MPSAFTGAVLACSPTAWMLRQHVHIVSGWPDPAQSPRRAGFAEPDNEHDQLMVPCVLPDASQWDEGLQAKMLQLHERGLRPQLFLPQAWLQRHLEQGSRCASCFAGQKMVALVEVILRQHA